MIHPSYVELMKVAAIDNDDICFKFIIGYLHAIRLTSLVIPEQAKHKLCIYQVLVTAKRDE